MKSVAEQHSCKSQLHWKLLRKFKEMVLKSHEKYLCKYRRKSTEKVAGTSIQNTPLHYEVTGPGDSGLDPTAKLKIKSTYISQEVQAVWASLNCFKLKN